MIKPDERLITRFSAEVLAAVCTLVFGGVIAYGSLRNGIGWNDSGPDSGYVPFYLGLIIIAASLGVIVSAAAAKASLAEAFLTREQAGRVLQFLLPLAAFIVAAVFLGLYVAMAGYLALVMIFQGRYRWWISLGTAFAATVFFYVLFDIWFQVPLLKGPVEAWLGIW